jgi:hypothetical protein
MTTYMKCIHLKDRRLKKNADKSIFDVVEPQHSINLAVDGSWEAITLCQSCYKQLRKGDSIKASKMIRRKSRVFLVKAVRQPSEGEYFFPVRKDRVYDE